MTMRPLLPFVYMMLLFSCNEKSSSTNAISSNADTPSQASTDVNTEDKVFDVPVLYKNWEMGSHENTRTVLKMYKAWDEKSIKDMEALLADSIIMELPDGKRRAAARDKMVEELVKARNHYLSTSNEIIAAYPIHNIDHNEDWVNVLVYNKWTYNDRVRDSLLYQDLWKIKDGKINYLLTLQLSPSRVGIKKLDEITNK
ncbi:hypothetical protein SY85_24325 [Flavisolibacter tropicus]|uniref:DUF4440 domain-containing protein n=2 Tax=Flavisolibacter tropicus TaxID=1492898 RepID=A0A172U1N1_9BACT|nr:hypothetical protein SY85_24325 [Flavisolibacter tropicus]